MFKFNSIRAELTVLLSIALAIILIVISIFFIRSVAHETQLNVEHGLSNELEKEVHSIEAFIKQRGEVVEAMLASPFFIDWFNNYYSKDQDLSEDKDLPRIIQTFDNLQKRDPVTKAFFFGAARTGEYFDTLSGRFSGTPDTPYDARTRPWWKNGIAQDRMYLTQPQMDYKDHTILSVIQRTVYNKQGELLGIAGVDILLSTLKQQIENQLKFMNQGLPIVINRDGRTIIFPESVDIVKANSDIGTIDGIIEDTNGFAEFKRQMQSQENGIVEVIWKGEPHLIAFQHISLDTPHVDWMLGLLITKDIIDKPIRQSILNSVLITLVILVFISLSIWIISLRITRPFEEVLEAMKGVAQGEGDLTARLDVKSRNEAGMFANQFNQFIGHIQEVMQQNLATVKELNESADKITEITNSSTRKAVKQRDSTDLVATAAEELSYSVGGISASSDAALKSAEDADNQVNRGVAVVEEATESIKTLANTVNESANIIDALNNDSAKISEVLEVIISIAEQTNLLALNAAIEAARAGEQGRGFAVVADEVRSLASRTQESTESIRLIIDGLQKNASSAVNAMVKGKEHAEIGVNKSSLVQEVLQTIASAISEIQSQSNEIAHSTGEQAKASNEITQQVAEIRKLSEETAKEIEQVQGDTQNQREDIKKLLKLINQFKIE
ncbi:methyl-accepting chemotaxis protein [Aliikangiella maris]|uniref:Methyl-accepting chemotaxis protein n=2 Tax=Aliikangiella maris TaxID=3162458 RepID=A0ABV3MST2_9GAMM